MPPPPKPAARRSRQIRGGALRGVAVTLSRKPILPDAPAGLTEHVAAAWTDYWSSPLATQVTRADLMALRRLFRLYDQRERFADAGLEEALATGSTGQTVLNPLIKHLPTLDAEILALEDRFGLNPRARLTLQVALGDAAESRDKLNRALRPADEAADARLVAFAAGLPEAEVG